MSLNLESVFLSMASTPSWGGRCPNGVNDRNDLDDTPLHTACSWGDLKAVQLLVKAGADVNATGDIGNTPLFNAIIGGNVDVISFLIKTGADVGKTNDYGWTPLYYAESAKSGKGVISLLKGKMMR